MKVPENSSLNVTLVKREDKKDFLACYMSYRMELAKYHLKSSEMGRSDQLTRFWEKPNSNYLLWLRLGKERVGFASFTVKDLETGVIEDLSISREFRSTGLGKKSLEEIKKFASYRGLKKLVINIPPDMEEMKRFFKLSGFKENGSGLYLELSGYRPQ